MTFAIYSSVIMGRAGVSLLDGSLRYNCDEDVIFHEMFLEQFKFFFNAHCEGRTGAT